MRQIMVLFFTIFSLLFLSVNTAQGQSQEEKMAFWNKTQKGANVFNREINREDIKAAKKDGIAFIRLAPDKFPTTHRDFLIGNADQYTELAPDDLAKLKQVLDMCSEEQMPVVITMLSLPGSRWKQLNGYKDDLRLWKDIAYQSQAQHFWKDLAFALRGHPAIIGYNLLNEPHPERLYESKGSPLYEVHQAEVQDMLFDFYQGTIKAIRSVDRNVPIIIDSTSYADPKTFAQLKPQTDSMVIYSFHMYEPFEYTNHKENGGKYAYPGTIDGTPWNKKALEQYLLDVQRFQKTHHIESNRILVGEFGGYRMSKGLPAYFKDLTSIFNENHWHTAFYAYREDTWDGMDYELGDKKLPWEYWDAVEQGKTPVLKRNPDAPAFKALIEDIGS